MFVLIESSRGSEFLFFLKSACYPTGNQRLINEQGRRSVKLKLKCNGNSLNTIVRDLPYNAKNFLYERFKSHRKQRSVIELL